MSIGAGTCGFARRTKERPSSGSSAARELAMGARPLRLNPLRLPRLRRQRLRLLRHSRTLDFLQAQRVKHVLLSGGLAIKAGVARRQANNALRKTLGSPNAGMTAALEFITMNHCSITRPGRARFSARLQRQRQFQSQPHNRRQNQVTKVTVQGRRRCWNQAMHNRKHSTCTEFKAPPTTHLRTRIWVIWLARFGTCTMKL